MIDSHIPSLRKHLIVSNRIIYHQKQKRYYNCIYIPYIFYMTILSLRTYYDFKIGRSYMDPYGAVLNCNAKEGKQLCSPYCTVCLPLIESYKSAPTESNIRTNRVSAVPKRIDP
jgi:hypothetical protein